MMIELDAKTEDVLLRLSKSTEDLVRKLTEVCQIPAPTFHEGSRAAFVADRMRQLGLADVRTDALHNVTGRLRLGEPRPRLLVVAHLDTVFPAETDVTVQRLNGRLHAPGVGDNAASMGCMLHVASQLSSLALPGEVIFAASVGEEGNGNLRGMRELMQRYGQQIDGVIAVDGRLGGVVTQAVGSRRYQIQVRGPGGHSWGDFGRPSAVHELARIVSRLSDVTPPKQPRTTFNVGILRGGNSVNSIAAEASAEVDLRSIDPQALDKLDREFHQGLAEIEVPADVHLDVEEIGARPVGVTPQDNWLAQAAARALRAVDQQPAMISSSTDANIPMAAGLPAVGFGVYRGTGAHTLKERLEIASLATGAQALLLLIAEALKSTPVPESSPEIH